jgi:hypothetical protein
MPTIARGPRETTEQLEAVLDLRDPIGVISIYVDADPTLTGGGPRAAWQAPVRDGLRRLRDEARSWPRENRVALEERLDGLAAELERLLDPRGPGRGRALFAAVSTPATVQLELRTPLSSLVALGAKARVLPLLEALGEARPAGVALVRRDRIKVLEWTPAGLEPLQEIVLGDPDPEGRGRPGGTNPADRQPGPERDLFERAHDARLAVEVRAAGPELSRIAADRGWDVLVVDGEPRLAGEVDPAFATAACELVRSPVPLGRLAADEVPERVAPVIAEVRAREEARLVELLETSPLVTRGAAAVGVALEQGRVDRLLLDPSLPEDGELLLRQAVATSAEVTVTPLPAGAAALLRW